VADSKLWSTYNPVHITAGTEAFKLLHTLVPSAGKLLLVTTEGFTCRGITEKVINQLGSETVEVYDQVTPNPELDDLDRATEQLRPKNFVGIIALGGGSVLDSGKILGVTLASDLVTPLDKVLRQSLKYTWDTRLPVIAIPTTSGTGSEVTSFATVWDQSAHKKHSVTGENIYPVHALLVPELTLSLPREETLYSGLDAISHALESLWNKSRSPVTEAYAMQALILANEALPIVLKQPNNSVQRNKMQQASFLAGLAISQTHTAIAHSISYPLTSHYGVPHGLACSFTLPGLIERYINTLLEGTMKRVIHNTFKMLKSLRLQIEIKKYLGDEDIYKFLGEMFQPDRARNYALAMTINDVEELLKRSILRSVRVIHPKKRLSLERVRVKVTVHGQ